MSPASISEVLQTNGVRVPAGELTPDTEPTAVEVGTPITTVEQLSELFVVPAAPGAAPVRLGDVAVVTAEPAPATPAAPSGPTTSRSTTAPRTSASPPSH